MSNDEVKKQEEQKQDEPKVEPINKDALLNELKAYFDDKFNMFKLSVFEQIQNNQPKQAEPKQEKTIDEMTPEELPIW